MNWFSSLFKRKDSAVPDDRYVMRLTIGHETYAVEEFDLKFKRDTDRDGLHTYRHAGGRTAEMGRVQQDVRGRRPADLPETNPTSRPHSPCALRRATASVSGEE